MVVRIRLARFGQKNVQLFKIFVADARCRRDGRHVEVVGEYDPTPGVDGNRYLSINFDRVKYWISVGAQPSETVGQLLGQAGVIPPPPEKPSRTARRIRTEFVDIPDGKKEKE